MKDSTKLAIMTTIASAFLGPAGPVVFWTGVTAKILMDLMSEDKKKKDCKK